jgi:hypothetical protein
MLRNNLEERRPRLHHGGSLKSRIKIGVPQISSFLSNSSPFYPRYPVSCKDSAIGRYKEYFRRCGKNSRNQAQILEKG